MTDNGQEPGRESPMVDVSSMSLSALASCDSSALANSLRHILADVEQSAEAISGWSSYVD
ncbi:hypothetical protein AB0B31_33215 [Catellatospora citrea]|uniref:hypothetical protein n=1 Tax=Catellatospora citrea TaxID=53366 RepID=UPI0033D595B7